MFHEDIGPVAGEHIPQNSAADACEYTDKGDQKEIVPGDGGLCDLNADYGEQAQTDGIHDQQQYIIDRTFFLKGGIDGTDKDDDADDDGSNGKDRVYECCRRCDVKDQIPEDPAADGSCQPENRNTEYVHFLLNADNCPGYRKSYGPDDFQDQKDFHAASLMVSAFSLPIMYRRCMNVNENQEFRLFLRKQGFFLSLTNIHLWQLPVLEQHSNRRCGMHHNFLFDLDQTLLDFHASEYKALGIVLRANGLSFSDEIYRAFKAYNKSLWLELEKGIISRTELFTKRFQDVFVRCKGDTAGLNPLKINDDFIRTMSVNGVLMDGALEFVKNVKETIADARIYIASNGATINAKGRIATTGLDRYIDGLFVSEDMGVTKPDAAFFDICLDQIGEPGSSCIMIGDSLSSDMLGAKNASLDSVWFMPSGDIEEAMKAYDINYCASSFDELYEVLKEWSVSH